MDEKREYQYRISPRDVDFQKIATLTALGDYILDAAGEDADCNGFGVRQLNQSNSSWVLTRMAMEISRMPAEYEDIAICTWVSDITRVVTTRNFEVYDAQRNLIASAVTNWAMIDLRSRRPLDLHKLDSYDGMTQSFEPPVDPPRKLTDFEPDAVYSHLVVYSDIDFNSHTNSMKYIQWAVDLLPIDAIAGRRFRRMDVNFLHETRHGQQLTIKMGGDGEFRFDICTEAGNPACRLALQLD